MMHLTKQIIRNLAADEKTYLRGVQYYQNGRIQNASYSKLSKRYKIIVKGHYDYTVMISENEDGSFDTSCNCPGALKERGACKHAVAALMMLLKYQERNEGTLPKNAEEKRSYQVLEYFDNQELVPMTGEVFHIEPMIMLPSMLRSNAGKAYIGLKAGSSKMYRVQNIRKFLEDYIKRENIILGKEFRYIAGESEFDGASKAVIDFLLSIYDTADLLENRDSTLIFMKSQVIVSKFLFIKFLKLLDNVPFQLDLYGKTYENVKCVPKNPLIELI